MITLFARFNKEIYEVRVNNLSLEFNGCYPVFSLSHLTTANLPETLIHKSVMAEVAGGNNALLDYKSREIWYPSLEEAKDADKRGMRFYEAVFFSVSELQFREAVADCCNEGNMELNLDIIEYSTGQEAMRLFSYKWDGFKAESHTHPFTWEIVSNYLTVANYNHNTCYGSKEDCEKSNAIKVNLFKD